MGSMKNSTQSKQELSSEMKQEANDLNDQADRLQAERKFHQQIYYYQEATLRADKLVKECPCLNHNAFLVIAEESLIREIQEKARIACKKSKGIDAEKIIC